MHSNTPALRLLAVALLAMLPPLPAAAGSATPEPVNDPYGLVVPLPGCGITGSVVTTRMLHRVGTPPVKHRRPGKRAARPARPPLADSGALAWQALYGCTAAVPEEAGVTAGARPLRPT